MKEAIRTYTDKDSRETVVLTLAEELEAYLRQAHWLNVEIVGLDGPVITCMVEDLFHTPRMVTITVAAI